MVQINAMGQCLSLEELQQVNGSLSAALHPKHASDTSKQLSRGPRRFQMAWGRRKVRYANSILIPRPQTLDPQPSIPKDPHVIYIYICVYTHDSFRKYGNPKIDSKVIYPLSWGSPRCIRDFGIPPFLTRVYIREYDNNP